MGRSTLSAAANAVLATRVHISKIDNGEMKTRTRINFDNRLFNNRLTYHLFIHQRRGTIVTGQNV